MGSSSLTSKVTTPKKNNSLTSKYPLLIIDILQEKRFITPSQQEMDHLLPRSCLCETQIYILKMPL